MGKLIKRSKNSYCDFVDEKKFKILCEDRGIDVAIKQTKTMIREFCNRKDNTKEAVELYKKLYNANKHLRFRLRDFLISVATLTMSYIFTKFTEQSERLNELLNVSLSQEQSINTSIYIGSIITFIISYAVLFVSFLLLALYVAKYIIKSLRNISSDYDIYIMPFLCDMLYERLKSEGLKPLKIEFD